MPRIRPSRGTHVILVARGAAGRRRRDRARRRRAHDLRAAVARAARSSARPTTTTRARSTTCRPPSDDVDVPARRGQRVLRHRRSAAPDLTGAYAGVRPLISTGDPKKSVDISRKAELYETSSGLVTITGGKLTTWRRMAKMAVDRIVEREGREAPCRTHEIPLGLPIDAGRRCPRSPGVDDASRARIWPRRYGHAAQRRAAAGRGGAGARPRGSSRTCPTCVAEASVRRPPRAGALAGRRAAAPHAPRPARRAPPDRAGRGRGRRAAPPARWAASSVGTTARQERELATGARWPRRGPRAGRTRRGPVEAEAA